MRFAGDNFARYSGDATNMQKLQLFAWQSGQRGSSVNISSNPTAAEMLNREFLQKKEVMKDTTKTSILSKYGGEEHLQTLPRELLTGQTEDCECPSERNESAPAELQTSSTRGQAMSSRGEKERRRGQSTTKTCISTTIPLSGDHSTIARMADGALHAVIRSVSRFQRCLV